MKLKSPLDLHCHKLRQFYKLRNEIACIASVSLGFRAFFQCLNTRKLGRERKNGGKNVPISARSKSEKGTKTPLKRLLHRLERRGFSRLP